MQPKQRIALELLLHEPGHDTYSALLVYEQNVSTIRREVRMSSHRFSIEDVKHAALWREITFFFFLQVLFNIYIYIYLYV